ncbi:uncharacterized protein [Prorops nasuta]|uniref:uncharacterized protein n=1 Tax=Prorops nasuta TaxID=863751 RepID=UPI0034CE2B93
MFRPIFLLSLCVMVLAMPRNENDPSGQSIVKSRVARQSKTMETFGTGISSGFDAISSAAGTWSAGADAAVSAAKMPSSLVQDAAEGAKGLSGNGGAGRKRRALNYNTNEDDIPEQ